MLARGEPIDRIEHLRRIDGVADVGLVVSDGQAAALECLAGFMSELDSNDRVLAPVGDEDREVRAPSQVRLQPPTTGTNPENARIPAGTGRSAPRPSA